MPTKVRERLLGTDARDPGCDACFEVLDQYADALLGGEDADARFPDMAPHLRQCEACREDTDGLLAALRSNISADT
jgi:hypothetical protein